MARRIGILGGTFNPIHLGHLAAAEEALGRLGLDRVLFIPSHLPPHKQERDMPSPVQRLEMVRLATQGNPAFETSSLEIDRGGRSFTIDTVTELRSRFPDDAFFFITGIDTFLDIRTWKEWERLLTLCTFVVLSRPGRSFRDLAQLGIFTGGGDEPAALDGGITDRATLSTGAGTVIFLRIRALDVSSTAVRALVREGRSAKYCLPGPVERYIIEHKFYV